jgi:hypothetical protein
MKSSTCIGRITDKRDIYKEVAGEIFFIEDFSVEDVTVPCVVSEFIINNMGGTIEAEVFIRSETIESTGKLFTFLEIAKARQVEEGSAELNEIELGGVVSQVRDMKLQKLNGNQVLPFILKYKTSDGSYSVAHVVAKGVQARQLSTLKKDDILEVAGSIKNDHGAIEVLVTRIDYHKESRRG